MNTTLNLGLAGYGFAGQTFHAPLIVGAGLRLAAIQTSQAERAAHDFPEARIVSDFDALLALPELDAIVIATPNDTHFDLACRALAAGKHVVVDKPVTVTLAEAEQLERAAARHQRLVAPFHNRRWDGDFLTVRALLASGKLGRLTHYESHFDRFRPLVRPRWREDAARGGGLLLDLGPHVVDQALQLFGLPDTLWATIATHRDDARADDYFHLVLGYPQLQVVLHASTLTALVPPRFALHGTRGSYLKMGLDTQEDMLKAGQRPGDAGFGHNPPGRLRTLVETGEAQPEVEWEWPTEAGAYTEFYRQFAAAVRQQAPLPVTVGQAIEVMRLLSLAQESAASGRRIDVK
jgi:scyllo-inositol 2-dehydrogenase (NADP+)